MFALLTLRINIIGQNTVCNSDYVYDTHRTLLVCGSANQSGLFPAWSRCQACSWVLPITSNTCQKCILRCLMVIVDGFSFFNFFARYLRVSQLSWLVTVLQKFFLGVEAVRPWANTFQFITLNIWPLEINNFSYLYALLNLNFAFLRYRKDNIYNLTDVPFL